MVKYIQQLHNHHAKNDDNENNDSDSESSINQSENDIISFYIDEATGKYLINYFNLVKMQISDDSFFTLFEVNEN
jgi:hypothetical protein